jgi:aspartyl-tRNA(Asn)/glutamyl-tRNA(Gln) amidotransferase subunit A
VIGKTNLDEFAMGSSTENSAWGPTRNPWDRERVPGGSSGGSAAAVAAHLAPVALGTDTGGSIRQPAALCGVVGLKPTWGRVSRWGAVAFASSLDQIGPLTRSVPDAGLVLSVIAGADPRDSTCATRPVPPVMSSPEPVRGLRLGVPWSAIEKGTDAGVMRSFRESLRVLEAEIGVTAVDVALPHIDHAVAAYYLVAPAEASSNLARYDGVRYGHRRGSGALEQVYGATRGRGFGAEVRRRLILGTFALSAGYQDAYYRRAQQVRALIRDDFDKAFSGVCDVVATPTSPTTAFRLGERTREPLQMYLSDVFTTPASLAGLPSVSLPCGLDDGLPVGLQLTGRAWDEEVLVRVGAAYQSVTDHHRARPVLPATA